MTTPEDRRREAPDGPEDDGDMRQDVNIHRIYIPAFTQRVIAVCAGLLVLIAAWGGTNIQIMQRDIAEQKTQQAQQNAAVLVEIANIKAEASVTSARVGGLESRTEKLEGRQP